MKNLLLAFSLLFAFGLTSCTKDYTCTCTSASTPLLDVTANINDAKKKDAEDACSTTETAGQTVVSDYTCELN